MLGSELEYVCFYFHTHIVLDCKYIDRQTEIALDATRIGVGGPEVVIHAKKSTLIGSQPRGIVVHA